MINKEKYVKVPVKWLLHKIAHLLGWYYGTIYSELRGSSVWVGFQCSTCKEITDLHCADAVIEYELQKDKRYREASKKI